MVVDDVQDDRDPVPVCGLDEALQSGGPAVGVMGGRDVDAVVAPTALARSLGDGHQLDGRHPELPQSPELGARPRRRSRRS